ncbi:MAG: hypothetical protein ACRCT7_17530 [Shewanella sp.]
MSCYFAAFGGDQGGITAFFVQMGVIVLYGTLALVLVITNYLMQTR